MRRNTNSLRSLHLVSQATYEISKNFGRKRETICRSHAQVGEKDDRRHLGSDTSVSYNVFNCDYSLLKRNIYFQEGWLSISMLLTWTNERQLSVCGQFIFIED